MQVKKRIEINAPIDKVFDGLTDIAFFKNEISRQSKDQRPKLHYDKKAPFREGNKIIISSDGTQLIFQIEELIKPTKLVIKIDIGGKSKELIGSIFYKVNLESAGKKTVYNYVYVTEKSPSGILFVILKIYLWWTSFSSNRRFKEYVRSKNV